jgi:hypothetical protein
MPRNTAPSIKAVELDFQAYDLRQQGLTFRQIGQQMGTTPQRAHQRVTRALARRLQEPPDAHRHLELERLDHMWQEALAVLRRPHVFAQNGKIVYDKEGEPLSDDAPVLNAIDRLLRIQERRARLLGLDAPTTSKLTVISEDAVDAEIRRLTDELARLEAGETPAAPQPPS